MLAKEKKRAAPNLFGERGAIPDDKELGEHVSETDSEYNATTGQRRQPRREPPRELPQDVAVCPTGLRKAVLKEYEGRCYWCAIEEWRLGKRLHMHRVVDKDRGGIYEWGNVVPLCPTCHRRAEDQPEEVIHASSWMRRRESEQEDGIGLMALLADDRIVQYRPRLNQITGSPLATIVLCQMVYWWFKSGRKAFYKFSAPCGHARYRPGDSWQEELGLSRHELEGALRRLGQRIKRGESREDALADSFVIWWMDGEKVTWYALNEDLTEARIADVYGAPKIPRPDRETEDEDAGETDLGPESNDDSDDDSGVNAGVNAEIPHRPEEAPEVDAEIPHRGGGVNAEIRHSIYDAEIRHPINELPEITPETTSSYKDPVPSTSCEADGAGEENGDVEDPRKRERTSKGTIRGLTNDEAGALIRESMEGDPFVDELRNLVRCAAAENKTNEMRLTKMWNGFVEPYLKARDSRGWSDESWRYGFSEAMRREAPSISYVMQCAGNHDKRSGTSGTSGTSGSTGSGTDRATSSPADAFGAAPKTEEKDYSWLFGKDDAEELTEEERLEMQKRWERKNRRSQPSEAAGA